MSSFEQPLGKENKLEIINQMQVNLAKRFYGAESNETLTKWISDYSVGFRELVNDNPDLIEKYRSEPNTVLNKIEEELYEKEEN